MPTLETIPAETLLLIALAFFGGGLSKGLVGIGLPLVSLPFLAILLPPLQAIAMLAVPVIATNFFQVFHRGLFFTVLARFWPMILAVAVTAVIASNLIVAANNDILLAIIGSVIIAVGAMRLVRLPVGIPERHELWLNPLVGVASGLVGSVSNLFGPPVFAYLAMRGTEKDTFIVVIAMVFLVGAVPLHGNLVLLGVTTPQLLFLSALAALPVFAGMAAGTWLRSRFSQAVFERILLAVIVIAGINLIRRGVF
jgi:uncharacterized protein